MPAETICWTLTNAEAEVVCIERQVDSHIELSVSYANLPIGSRRCLDREEAARYSEQLRSAWAAACSAR